MKAVLIIVALLAVFACSGKAKDDKAEQFANIVAKDFELIDVDYSKISAIPASINWTALGAVSPAVSERHYRNSWAFAVNVTLPTGCFIKKSYRKRKVCYF